jgi:hypothetical protein
VIAHSCTFFSNYLFTGSLAPAIRARLPKGWDRKNNAVAPNIAVRRGQVIAKTGGGVWLDFAVWDTRKTLHFLEPAAYNNAEEWKINTVPPLNYFTSNVKRQILPKYVRTASPRDGKIDYDKDGTALGNWFVAGSNGYAGSRNPERGQYYRSHLALVYNFVDPTAIMFSTGSFNGQPRQFAIVGNAPDPAKVSRRSGVVKYELGELQYTDGQGNPWDENHYATGIHVRTGPTQGVLLIKVLAKRKMRVEVFPGKTPDQVSGFDAHARTYNRGQDAVMQ